MVQAKTPRLQLTVSLSTFLLFVALVVPGIAREARFVMVTEQWPPFRINDSKSPSGFTGVDIDLTHRLAEALGIAIEIQRCPWARALEQMSTGQADMITGVALTPQREAFMHYVPVSYGTVQPVFFTQKGRAGRVRSYEDLIGPSVGYSLNSAYFEPFNSDSRINKIGISTEIQLLHMLALKRIDITIGTDPNIFYDIARLGYRNVLEPTVWQPSVKTELYIALSRKSPIMAFSRQIEETLKRLLTDGTVDRILQDYR